jgi:hypothetical protein
LRFAPQCCIFSAIIHKQRGIDFVRNKLKGTIAEIIFQHMFQEDGFATVLPFGYEKTQPILAQYQHVIETAQALAHIRNTPDYILVRPDNRDIVLVDVKYRHRLDPVQVHKIVEGMLKHWETAWLFLATREGFYFGPCEAIAKDHGAIAPLREQWIPRTRQEEYLALLRQFIS